MKIYKGKDRYQFQPTHVKAWRSVIHAPRILCLFIACMVKWAWHRFEYDPEVFLRCENRWQVFKRSCRIWKSVYDYERGWYWSWDELMEESRSKAKAGK